ncbi:MAG: hypothetical protein KDB07_04010, partial [Planctomycetes bacterium]|nr:hypothetical protein [Planctomycetota bacterium]
VVLNIYPSPFVRVVNNQSNPQNPKGVVLWGCDIERQNVTTDKYASGEVIAVSNAWRRDGDIVEFARFRGGNMVEPWSRSSLKRIPVTHVFDAKPEPRTGYYVPARGELLCTQTMLLNNDFLASLGQAAIMQGFSVLVIQGLGDEVKLKIGPSRAIVFPSGNRDDVQDAHWETPNAPLRDILDITKELVREVERSHGIPESSINVETDSSGAAIIQANGPVAEMRNARKPLFRRVETDLLRNVISVLNAFENGFDAGDASEWDVHVEYEQAQASASIQDKIAYDNHLLELGVLSAAQIAMRERAGEFDSEDEAQEYIDKNLERDKPAPSNEPVGFAPRSAPQPEDADEFEGFDEDLPPDDGEDENEE